MTPHTTATAASDRQRGAPLREAVHDAERRATLGRARRCLVFAPTATSALLLAACMFLPFGLYGGCSNAPPQAVSPHERQVEAIASGDVGGLIMMSLPYVLALAVGLGTLVTGWFGGPRAAHMLWLLYAGLIMAIGTMVMATFAYQALTDHTLHDAWAAHGYALLSVFWLFNVVLAIRIEAPSRFVGAMLLQLVVVLLIWASLTQWLVFLESLLIGGWITAACAIVLPLATGLQLFGDPASCRETASLEHGGSGVPQFSLRGLLVITALCAVMLATGRVWAFEHAAMLAYVSVFGLLALHSRRRRVITCWYALVALLLGTGGLAAL